MGPPVMGTGEKPIRVVVFGGAFFEPAARRFLMLLEEHPDIALVGVICQSPGFGLGRRVANVVRRRRAVAPLVLGVSALQFLGRLLRYPGDELRLRRAFRRMGDRLVAVPDIHHPDVLDRVRSLRPDLGLIYGSPLLKPALFEIPGMGTFGIHHGKLPEYRGKKTTFWALYNGERTAGVAIQKINAGLDTGEIVSSGEVPTAGRRYRRLEREVEELGLRLYVDAILAARRGDTSTRTQPPGSGRLYRQPSPADIFRLWKRRLVGSARER